MPIDREDLEARIAAAKPDDTVRGLIFNAVFDLAEEHLGKAGALACDPHGKAKRTDFFSYPVVDFLRISSAAADALEPKLGSVDAALHGIGYRAVSNVFSSTLGATLLALASKNVRGMLSQAPGGYKATVSYGERRLEWVAERHARFHFVRDFVFPAFHCGVIQGAIEAFGAQAPSVTGAQTGFLEAVYDVTWQG
jgi:uncharacterized protein (TIGR02265 family)